MRLERYLFWLVSACALHDSGYAEKFPLGVWFWLRRECILCYARDVRPDALFQKRENRYRSWLLGHCTLYRNQHAKNGDWILGALGFDYIELAFCARTTLSDQRPFLYFQKVGVKMWALKGLSRRCFWLRHARSSSEKVLKIGRAVVCLWQQVKWPIKTGKGLELLFGESLSVPCTSQNVPKIVTLPLGAGFWIRSSCTLC